jgi:hypothetical protein
MANINKIKIGSETLEFTKVKDDRIVIYKGKNYKILLNLLNACPDLIKDLNNLVPFAKVVNYTLFGDQFSVIENPKEYIDKYWERLKKEAAHPSKDPEIAKMWQVIFNVYLIVVPIVMDNLFICYLEHHQMGLPFMLVLPYPIKNPLFEFKLDKLPFAEQ